MRMLRPGCCYRALPFIAVLVAASVCCAEERIDHLVKAAAHLDQAGFPEKAAEIREIAKQQGLKDAERLLEQKMTQLQQLRAEVEQLQLAIAASPHIVLRLKVFEFSPDKLKNQGFPLVSLRHLLDNDSTSCLVDETGTLVEFLDFLSDQGLAKVVCDPSLVTIAGRPVSLFIGQHSCFETSESNWTGTSTPPLGESAFRFDCTASTLTDNELELRIRLCQTEPEGAGSHKEVGSKRSANAKSLGTDARVKVQSGQRLILCGRRRKGKRLGETGIFIALTAELAQAVGR